MHKCLHTHLNSFSSIDAAHMLMMISIRLAPGQMQVDATDRLQLKINPELSLG